MHEVTTAEELDALPIGSVVLDAFQCAWQKTRDGDWQAGLWRATWDSMTGVYSENLSKNIAPLTVLFRPDAPQPATVPNLTDEARATPEPSPNLRAAHDHLAAQRGREAVDREAQDVATERRRQVATGYDEVHDDQHGAFGLARMAQGYVLRGLDQGNREDFIKAAGLLEAAAASFRRLGHPLGTTPGNQAAWEAWSSSPAARGDAATPTVTAADFDEAVIEFGRTTGLGGLWDDPDVPSLLRGRSWVEEHKAGVRAKVQFIVDALGIKVEGGEQS